MAVRSLAIYRSQLSAGVIIRRTARLLPSSPTRTIIAGMAQEREPNRMSVSRGLALAFPRLLALSLVLGAVGAGSPARAGDYVYFGGYCYRYDDAQACFRHAQHAIYHKQNLIAHLEANPDVDDGYKAAVIPWVRAKVHYLRQFTGVRRHWWPTPCCYSRQPIYIR
jgi:hypothetical protein